jgi:hypothetical protein
MCGAQNERGARVCDSCNEPLSSRDQRSRSKSDEPQKIDLGVVLSRAWRCFKDNMGLVIGAQVLVFILNYIANLPAGIAQAVFEANGNGNDPGQLMIGLGLFLGLTILGSVFSIWINLGTVRLMLAVVRDEEASLGMIFSGGPYLLRGIGCSILQGLVVFLGIVLCIIPGLIAIAFLWPVLYVLVDDDAPHIQAFLDTPTWSKPSWLSSIAMFFVAGGIMILGLLALVVGVLIAGPYVATIFAVAYDEMRGGTGYDVGEE